MKAPTSVHILLLIPIFALTTACGGGGGGGGSTNNSGNNDTDNDGVANATDVDGDNDGLIEVLSLEQLDWMRHDLTGTSRNDGQGNVSSAGCPAAGCNGYELAANLDFDTNGDGQMTAADAYYDYDNDGANNGWLPIGNSASAFDANFNGNNRRIANLFIDRPAGDAETSGTEIGLFGQIRNDQNGSTSQPIAIQNIRLDGPLASVTGHSFVGALAGVVRASNGSITVSNIDVDAQVTGESSIAASNVGGLAGLTWGGNALGLVMSDNSVSGTVTGGGTVGGMIGQMNGASTLSNAISDAMVIAELDQVGGLVGAVFPSEPEPTILDTCAATGDVWGRINVGGAFGHVRIDFSDLSSVEITHCAASGAVTGWETAVGGLIGRASIDNSLSSYIEVRDSYATGSVIGVGAVGGFLGHSEGESGDRIVIENVYASGTVDGGTGNYIGGLAGLTYYTDFRSSFSSGNVNGHWYVAGLIGDANTDTSITASYTTSSITASSGTGIGAFVGWSDGASYAQNHFEADSSGLPGVGFVNSGSPGSDVMGYTLAELQCPTAAGSTTCAAGTLYLDWDSYLNEEGEPAWDFGGTTDLPGLQIDGEVRRNPETL